MVGGQDRIERVAEQLLAVEAGVVAARRRRALHAEDQVDVAGDEHGHGLGRLGLLDPQRDRRRGAPQRPRGRGQQARQRGREARDAHLSARRRVLRREIALEPFELGEERVGVAEQHMRGGRQADTAARRLEQRVAELALERRELLRDRRGREMQGFGRRGERSVIRHRPQGSQPSKVDHEVDLTGSLHNVQSLFSVATRHRCCAMPRRHVAIATAVAVIWGVNFVVIHVGLESFPPLLFAALRFSLVALALPFVPRPGVPVRYVVAVGTFLSAGQFALLFVGMDHGMPAGLASLVLQLQAAFTVGLAVLFLERAPEAGAARGRDAGVRRDRDHRRRARVGGPAGRARAHDRRRRVVGRRQRRHAQGAAPHPLGLLVYSSLIPPLPLLALSLATERGQAVELGAVRRARAALRRRALDADRLRRVGLAAGTAPGLDRRAVHAARPRRRDRVRLAVLSETPTVAELAGAAVVLGGLALTVGLTGPGPARQSRPPCAGSPSPSPQPARP